MPCQASSYPTKTAPPNSSCTRKTLSGKDLGRFFCLDENEWWGHFQTTSRVKTGTIGRSLMAEFSRQSLPGRPRLDRQQRPCAIKSRRNPPPLVSRTLGSGCGDLGSINRSPPPPSALPSDISTMTTPVTIINTAATMLLPIKMAGEMPPRRVFSGLAASFAGRFFGATAGWTLDDVLLTEEPTFVAALAAAAFAIALVSVAAGLDPDLATAGTGPVFVTAGIAVAAGIAPDLATAGIDPD